MDIETGIILETILRSKYPEHVERNLEFELDESYDNPDYMRVWVVPLAEESEREPVFISRIIFSMTKSDYQSILPW